MLEAVPDLDALVVSVGGGGLIAGMAVAARDRRPDIDIVGVQTTRFPTMVNAVHGTQHVLGTSTIAEGIAVGTPGERTLAIIRRHVDDLLLVDEGDIEQAVAFIDPEVIEKDPIDPIELERFKQVQVAGYRERTNERAGEFEVSQVVQIDLVNRHTQEVRSVVDVQRWRYDPVAKRWWLMSGLPPIEKRAE